MGKKDPITQIGRATPIGMIGRSYNDANKNAVNAAQGAALAQQRAAQASYDETARIINPATTAGLLAFDRDIKNQEKNLARQEQLISQLDPTVIEASQQALRLLRGEQSSVLGPAQNQRAIQRQKLLNQLREQLGPGAETSTAGIQALTRFDSETNNLMAGMQQQALANLGNIGSQFNSQRPDMFREIMGLSGLNQGKTDLSFRQSGALGNARMGLQQTAGAEYTGQALRAQQQQSLNNMLINTGIQGGMAYATGGMSALGGASAGAAAPGGGGGQFASPRGIGG